VKTLLAFDISGIFHAAWHASADKPASEAYSITTSMVHRLIDDERKLEGAEVVALIACDAPGKKKRHEFYPEYKANRPPPDAAMLEQMDRTVNALRSEGHAVWEMPGYEADDIIASAATLARGFTRIVIVSSDKDLCQLIGDNADAIPISVYRPIDRKEYTADDVKAKWGVEPKRLRDLFALTGDTSDNIPGVKGIGPKTAARMLERFGSLDGVATAVGMQQHAPAKNNNFTPSIFESLSKSLEKGPNGECDLWSGFHLLTLVRNLPLPYNELHRGPVPTTVRDLDPGHDDEELPPEAYDDGGVVVGYIGGVNDNAGSDGDGEMDSGVVGDDEQLGPQEGFDDAARGAKPVRGAGVVGPETSEQERKRGGRLVNDSGENGVVEVASEKPEWQRMPGVGHDTSAPVRSADAEPQRPVAKKPERQSSGEPATFDLKMQSSEAIDQLALALAKAQARFTAAAKTATARVQTKGGQEYSYSYAKLGDVLVALRPLAEEGIAVIQVPGQSHLKTILAHGGSGQWMSATTPIMFNGGGPQAFGSALTYARRYAITAMTGLPLSEAEDDDGAKAQSYHQEQRRR
jgi:5'-3' exonuclease